MTDDTKNRFELDEEENNVKAPTNQAPLGGGDDPLTDEAENVIDFFRYPREKRKLTEFLQDTYKKYEHENIDRVISRITNEHTSELEGSTPYYKPGHIGPLLYEYLNMIGVESAFVSGIQHTKSSLTKSVQQRVDEINTLLRGVGGFNRQIKASFTRNSVIYLEQEDPANHHRERVIFSINLSDFELRRPLGESARNEFSDDGRSLQRVVWDDAINNLCTIVSNTGLKPKYIKNDKESCKFTMRQLLVPRNGKYPDEFFDFGLKYIDEETRIPMTEEYEKSLAKFDKKIVKLEKKMLGSFLSHKQREKIKLDLAIVKKEREYFLATNPDPREIDSGLLFSIFANTMKDYSLTKDKMQVIMTKFILSLSAISVERSMNQQLSQGSTQRSKAETIKDFVS